MSIGIRARAINWIVNNAQRNHAAASVNRASDSVGNVLQYVTRGFYRKGLSRASVQLTLHQGLKPGDVLSIKDGEVRKNGSLILTDRKLFHGINIEQKEVTEKMCTPEGMASHLRWDIIGNTPELISFSLPIIGSLYLGYKLTNSALEACRCSHDLGSLPYFLLTTIIFVPYYKLLSLFVPKEEKSPKVRLSDVEHYSPREYRYTKSKDWIYFMNPMIPGVLFTSAFGGSFAGSAIVHEKAHLLGASEDRANKIQEQKSLKSIFFNKQKISLFHIFDLFKLFLSAVGGNFASVFYFLSFKINYLRGSHRNLSSLAYDRSKLKNTLEAFEKGDRKLDDFEAAVAYKLYGDLEKSLEYYLKALNGTFAQRYPEIKSYFYFAIGDIQQELGNMQEARKAFQEVINMGQKKDPRIYTAAEIALEKITQGSE